LETIYTDRNRSATLAEGTPAELPRDQWHFIDDFAAQWERVGANVTQGRVLPLIYLAPQGKVTATDPVETLGVSRGAVSQITRQLIQLRMVQRVSRAGDRRDWFRIAPNLFGEAARAERGQIQTFIELLRRGLEMHATSPPEHQRALTNSIAFLQASEAALGTFLGSWRAPDQPEIP
jgi:DNA-binding transcriptional regulator GbsR (MarR family)